MPKQPLSSVRRSDSTWHRPFTACQGQERTRPEPAREPSGVSEGRRDPRWLGSRPPCAQSAAVFGSLRQYVCKNEQNPSTRAAGSPEPRDPTFPMRQAYLLSPAPGANGTHAPNQPAARPAEHPAPLRRPAPPAFQNIPKPLSLCTYTHPRLRHAHPPGRSRRSRHCRGSPCGEPAMTLLFGLICSLLSHTAQPGL